MADTVKLYKRTRMRRELGTKIKVDGKHFDDLKVPPEDRFSKVNPWVYGKISQHLGSSNNASGVG